MIIRNREGLLTYRGNIAGREMVLDVLETGLAAPDPYNNVRKMVRLEDGRLIVGHPDLSDPPGQAPLVFDLAGVGNIYVVGGGKVAQRQAEALEDVLGDRIVEGHINANPGPHGAAGAGKGDTVRLKRIEVTLAGHPLPDEDSVEGAQRIVEIERKARRGDIVFVCQSGGATALTALPAPGISLADLQEVYRVLYFRRGANMPAANAVRNQLVLLQGRHARHIGEATMIHVLTSETPSNLRVHLYEPPQHGDGYAAAVDVLKTYRCWDSMPEAVKAFLTRADPRYGPVRPEEVHGKPHHYFRVTGPEYMLEAARKRAEALGLHAVILATSLNDVEARPVAETLACMASEIEYMGRPVVPPCMLICGGELVVAVGDETGVGGRNQEFVLAATARIAGSPNIVIASVDSEGTDGPTEAAGGIVDGPAAAGRIREAGMSVFDELSRHNSHQVLRAIGDAIYTGVRGTNVRDLRPEPRFGFAGTGERHGIFDLIYIGGSRTPTWVERAP